MVERLEYTPWGLSGRPKLCQNFKKLLATFATRWAKNPHRTGTGTSELTFSGTQIRSCCSHQLLSVLIRVKSQKYFFHKSGLADRAKQFCKLLFHFESTAKKIVQVGLATLKAFDLKRRCRPVFLNTAQTARMRGYGSTYIRREDFLGLSAEMFCI